ncbi:heavy metal translocating P-type ATPase [uncultured Megasphaera sp.]|uniref:heavy metal translocating P-type ATPase n=1 Tax=uncultured Megasphaera sp. TaxID=165188 RepID=UPI0025DBB241|nr:heavy metal translocating P-type ATPase [uncultured Megasphaera sp.]
MKQFVVTGMSCAACQARVEKAVSKVPGVDSCSVSLLTNSMGVNGSASDADIIKAVTDAGYGAKVKGAAKEESVSDKLAAEEEALADHDTPVLKRRLKYSVLFLLILMYFTMGHNMLGLPLPTFLDGNYLGLALVQMILALVIMNINKKFFTSGISSLLHGGPNMDTLVALGSGVSFLWSLSVFFHMTGIATQGGSALVLEDMYRNTLYFESAAMIPTLITVGKMLEAMSKGRTTDALKGLMKLAPKKATLVRDGQEVEVGIDEVRSGDIFVVKPGENIPVDGVIVEGESAVNESALTGESIPVDKAPGSTVSAATINQSGFLKCRATRVGEDTTLSQIIKMVSDAAATKAPIARIADKVSAVFVPAVIAIAVVVTAVWLFLGATFAQALEFGISVLVISCPCALGLATPVAIMVGNGMGAKNGILFKTSESLENAGKVQIVALDKTGTITYGRPEVTDIVPGALQRDELLDLAYALEQKSEHPLAKAIVKEAERQHLTAKEVMNFKALPGNGLTAQLDGKEVHAGSGAYIASRVTVPAEIQKMADSLASQGKTPLFFEKDGKLAGVIAVADVIKEDSPEAIRQLHKMGVKVVMITGDNERTAQAISKEAGVDAVVAGVLPDGKDAVIQSLKKGGKVAMVGDGINDAPALTRADVGIAIGAGTDVAIDSADVVLMNSTLSDVASAIRLSRQTVRNIHENLFWAFAYNVLLIPLAAGLYPIKINPMFGAAAMAISSFTVCMNALRLNTFNVHSTKNDKALKHPADLILPEKTAASPLAQRAAADVPAGAKKEVVEIEGMMCGHCENRIQKALGSLDGVVSVKADHQQGTAVMVVTKPISPDAIKEKVEGEDYKFIGIRKDEPKEENDMKKVLKITGMMCGHCEATVKKALEALDGVEEATASHEKGEAVVKLSKDVADATLKKTVEDKDYKVTDIKTVA